MSSAQRWVVTNYCSSMHHAGRLLRGSLDLSMTLPTGVAAADPMIAGMGIVPCELTTVAGSAAVPAAERLSHARDVVESLGRFDRVCTA
jgi:hypothetical protein